MAYSCKIVKVSSMQKHQTFTLVSALSRAYSSMSFIARFATHSEMGDPMRVSLTWFKPHCRRLFMASVSDIM